MQSDFVLTIVKSTLSKKRIDELAKHIAETDYPLKALIDLTFHPEEQIGFRASWILENVYLNHGFNFMDDVIYFLTKFQHQGNLSSRRHFGKILALMTAKKAPKHISETINSYQTDSLVETVFSWLIDEEVPVAVKSHCLNILANLSIKHLWVKDELLETIDFLITRESIAFYAKAKQIRKQLKLKNS